jgi:hypothetical protein
MRGALGQQGIRFDFWATGFYQGLTGDPGGGRTGLAASGIAPARRCQP